jgi:pyridoxamine 5'-phosphate oxidase
VDEHELDADPLIQLQAWLDEAGRAVPLPEAMTLATVGQDGRPSARVVLLRGIDERGLTFFTNRASRKGDELRASAHAALVLHWWELGRQVRVEGGVEETSFEDSEAYWVSRPRASRIAAWASPQSEVLTGRTDLEKRVAKAEARFEGVEIPLPPFWGGYRVVPDVIEFWRHDDDRLHDRIRYVREGNGWRRDRLAP